VVCPIGDGGPALEASFSFPGGQAARPGGRIDIDADGNLFVADTSNFRLRKIDTAGVITTVAGTGEPGQGGDGGPATAAQLSRLTDVVVAPDGSLYIADNENSCIRVVRPDGTIATAAGVCGVQGFSGDGGPPEQATLDRPYGVALDAAGNLYIADTHNNRIRVVQQQAFNRS
jgi:sugar lactone lactonase YvrE